MRAIAVTGSESGMGAAIAAALREQGDRVIGVDLPGKGAMVEGDLSTSGGRHQIVDGILRECGGVLHGLVCNAGVDSENTPLVFSVNYLGVVELMTELNPALAAAGYSAAVVNVSNSIAVTPNIPQEPIERLLAGEFDEALELMAAAPQFSYQVSKSAVARWLRANAATSAWAGRGVTVNGICPGPVMTPLLERDLDDPWKRDAILGLPRPLREFTPPERIADLVLFLLSGRARFIVGQLIMIDGGIEATFRGPDYPSPWIRPQTAA